MKKWCYLLGVAVLAVVLVLIFHGRTQTHAISGCCMERSSYNAQWYRSGRSFV